MEKDQGEGYEEMSREEYERLNARLEKNKLEFFRILEENPKVGVYANEARQDWNRFFTFYINFLKSEIGPRGECAKKVRAQLLQRADEINKALLPFKQNASTHIREIFMKHKFFVPCKEYSQLLKIEEANAKFISNLEKLRDPTGPMVKSIIEGLRAKHGDQYNFDEQLKRLQQNYIVKIEQTERQTALLKQEVNKCEAYHQYMRVKQTLEPYFKAWVEADSMIGRESVKTGSLFEDKVMKHMIPYLIYRERNYKNWKYSDKKIQVFTNASWIPKNLGEIDIAFGYKDETEDRYFIFTLIQCKSRLFDLREAYKQVSLDDQESVDKGPTLAELKEMKKLKQLTRDKMMKNKIEKNQGPKPESLQPVPEQQKKKQEPKPAFNINKKFLSTKYGPAELVNDHHFYIITTLPQNDFVLPIESKMKEGIERHTKNLFTEDIQSQPLYQCLLQRFSQVKSPLEWIKLHEQKMKGEGSNILVLN